MKLQFKFLQVDTIAPEVQAEIDQLAHLAYRDAERDKNWPSNWANPTWMILGYLGDTLVCQLCLLKREILVGGHSVSVAGVGGVATHPEWQRKGFARQLMADAETTMRNELKTSFALLLCEGMPCTIYRRAGWKDFADHIVYEENNGNYTLETNVMIFEFNDLSFPEGEICLCGLPW